MTDGKEKNTTLDSVKGIKTAKEKGAWQRQKCIDKVLSITGKSKKNISATTTKVVLKCSNKPTKTKLSQIG